MTYAIQATLTTGTTANNFAIGDMNGDGVPDVLTSNLGSSTVSVFLQNTTTKVQRFTSSGCRISTTSLDGGLIEMSIEDASGLNYSVAPPTEISRFNATCQHAPAP